MLTKYFSIFINKISACYFFFQSINAALEKTTIVIIRNKTDLVALTFFWLVQDNQNHEPFDVFQFSDKGPKGSNVLFKGLVASPIIHNSGLLYRQIALLTTKRHYRVVLLSHSDQLL